MQNCQSESELEPPSLPPRMSRASSRDRAKKEAPTKDRERLDLSTFLLKIFFDFAGGGGDCKLSIGRVTLFYLDSKSTLFLDIKKKDPITIFQHECYSAKDLLERVKNHVEEHAKFKQEEEARYSHVDQQPCL